MSTGNIADKKEACKTYLEQTKLLTTLASAFIIAPVAFYKDLQRANLTYLIVMESLFVGSVLFGYVVYGSVAGSQNKGDHDVYRPATRIFSLMQLAAYLIGLVILIVSISQVFRAKKEPMEKEPAVKVIKNYN